MKYGLQMYSVRDLANAGLRDALKNVADIGYSFVEFAGFFGNSAESVKGWLKDFGLEVSGTHTGIEELAPDKIEETIAYHTALGNKNIIVPWSVADSSEELKEIIDAINFAQPKLSAAGIALGYHNHAHEFQPGKTGIVLFDELFANTDVEFEIDTYWAFVAGCDPLAVLDKVASRAQVIHLKDGLKSGAGKALGEGEAPVRNVLNKASQMGLKIVVESETQQPDGPAEVTRCMNYLHSVES